ncbi:hypothetical protein GCM10012275_57230 [Longimycelium tulufanense]|uniref:IrrE N-terminal-like domain-containing protein n=1 Tax=Longimycelium tulufanense TaxID=907463 RepID=A0A8J3FY48_9PSEU|nr:hypothetical protein GCM10012275_57230 [Longimycelium tulufanense]
MREIPLPRPFSVRALCDVIAEQRRRPLYLHPLPAEANEEWPCGMWIATERADHIFYEERTSAFHRDHIILHEIGHMLCDHTVPALPEQLTSPPDDQVDTRLAQHILRRTSYTTRQEKEAEMVASLILEQVTKLRGLPSDEHDRWLGSVLGVVDD